MKKVTKVKGDNLSPLKDIFKCSEIKNHISRKEPNINFEERKESEILDEERE